MQVHCLQWKAAAMIATGELLAQRMGNSIDIAAVETLLPQRTIKGSWHREVAQLCYSSLDSHCSASSRMLEYKREILLLMTGAEFAAKI
jgi:hypothetical protein